MEQLHALAQSVLNNPETTIGDLGVLGEAERIRLLVELNDTLEPSIGLKCIHHLIEEQVDRAPDRVAVSFEGEELTYAELNARSNQLARHLSGLGIGPEAKVALCLDRSLEMVISLLGVLKAGGAYVPLDPSYPKERLAFMLKDSEVMALITEESLRNQFDYTGLIICPESDWQVIARNGRQDFDGGASAENLAYVIYTSGSTGKPKGVMISHGAISNRLLWMQKTFLLAASDRLLQKTAFSFDASVWEFYVPLVAGAELCIARPGGHQESDYLARTIAEQEVTILQMVPSMLRILLDEPGFEKCISLRRVFCGGEALPAKLKGDFFARLPAKLVNLYGPTEVSIDGTYFECEPTCREAGGADCQANVPIGSPLSNLKVYLLDKRMNLTPFRVAGELHISGVGLARGYINRPQLTAEKFIPNLFSDKVGDQLYRTGDLARHLQDGKIEFLGRIDQQVKIRGFRIELGEIEAVLEQSQSVKKAVVAAREDAQGGTRLVAYIIPAVPGEQIGPQLRDSLKGVLPDYMIPSAFVMMKAFAFTPNGKLDRLKLPSPEQALMEEFAPPSTPVEERIAKIWAEVLDLPTVGVHNTFFDLGGHSLIATEIVSRMRVEFEVELTVRTLFDTPTVAGLARIISGGDLSKLDAQTLDRIPRRSRSIENQLEELDIETTKLSDHSRVT